jgi:hypothetical protein
MPRKCELTNGGFCGWRGMACSGGPKTNPSNRNVKSSRLASADLLGFARRLRN